MKVSVKTSVTTAWFAISAIVVISFGLDVPMILLSESKLLPLCVAIPIAIVLPLFSMGFLFHVTATRWLIWAFKNVSDVYELEKMLHTSGFGAYGPGSLEKKHSFLFNEIKERFDSYEFTDDLDVLSETTIYNKTFYQNGYFVFFSLLAIFMAIVAIIFSSDGINAAVIIPLLFAGFAIFQYIQIADRSPQLILNEAGIQLTDIFLRWEEIRNYGITSGKTSYLTLYLDETDKEIVIDYLHVSKVRLNHLLHVYRQRHRIASLHKSHSTPLLR